MKSEDAHIFLGKWKHEYLIILKSYEAVKKFLDQNNLLAILRAHEAQIDGQDWFPFYY